MDNVNTITNTVNFSRWIDSGGVYGYYDWLLQNELATKAIPGLSLEFATDLHNSVTLKFPYGPIPELKINLNYGKGLFDSSNAFIPNPNYLDLDVSLEKPFGIGAVKLTKISLTGDYIEISYLGETRELPIDSPESLKRGLGDLGLSEEEADFVSVEFFKIVDQINEIAADVREQVTNGFMSTETVDLSDSQGAINIDLISGIALSLSSESSVGVGDRVNVIGTLSNDTIAGNSQDNTIYGGSGHDYVGGGQGADALYGGSGSDTLSYLGSSSGVTVNLANNTAIGGDAEGDTLAGFENVIGSSYADIFWTNNTTTSIVAGGDDDDTFNISTIGSSPAIIWGGAGIDVVSIATGGGSDPAGILVVQVDGLTEENFHQFDLEALGLGNSFNWSEIDVVLLNPESADQLFIDGVMLETQSSTSFTLEDLHYVDFLSNETGPSLEYKQALLDAYLAAGYQIVSDEVITHPGDVVDGPGAGQPYRLVGVLHSQQVGYTSTQVDGFGEVYSLQADFLGGGADFEIFAAAGGSTLVLENEFDGVISESGLTRGALIASTPLVSFSWTDPSGVEFGAAVRSHYYEGTWQGYPNGLDGGEVETFNPENLVFTESSGLGSWFIVGGSMAGSSVLGSGTVSFTMPDPSETSGGSSSGGSGGSSGGGTG